MRLARKLDEFKAPSIALLGIILLTVHSIGFVITPIILLGVLGFLPSHAWISINCFFRNCP